MAFPLMAVFDKAVDKLFPGAEQKAQKYEAKAKLIEAEQKGEFIELETRMQAIIMEAKSKDPWTSRARPSFLYVIYILILSAIPMGFLYAFQPEMSANVIVGFKDWLNAIPGELYALFGAGYLGYTKSRENDKARLLGKDPGKGLLGKLF